MTGLRHVAGAPAAALWLAVAATTAGAQATSGGPAAPAWTPPGPVRVRDNVLELRKHTITVADSALPAQIHIKADRRELPLRHRGARGKVPQDVLSAIGRGDQLRGPMRLEVATKDGVSTAKCTRPADAADASASEVTYEAALKGGPLRIDVRTRYELAGAVTVRLTYTGRRAAVRSLALAMDLAGAVDTAYAGLPADVRCGQIAYEKLSPAVRLRPGAVLWASHADRAVATDPIVRYLFFGSGDRGFTWLLAAGGEKGFVIDPGRPVMTLEQDKAGRVTWRVWLVNRPATLNGSRTVAFSLLTHPARAKAPGFRRRQWLAWPTAAERRRAAPPGYDPDAYDGLKRSTFEARLRLRDAVAALTKDGAGNAVLLGALTAGAFEAYAPDSLMAGAACADVLSVQADGAALYPISLFRFMAGTHTGLATRIRGNVGQVVGPGDDPRCARGLLGRALLHDVGVDPTGLPAPHDYLRVLGILDGFGCFADDATEVIPYWRGKRLIRYGAAWGDGDFRLTRSDPFARVHVTVFRRRFEGTYTVTQRHRGERTAVTKKGKGFKALIVVVNETDEAVRRRLHVLNPKAVYGGPCSIHSPDVRAAYTLPPLEDLGDWDVRQFIAGIPEGPCLVDVETHGFVHLKRGRGIEGEQTTRLHVRPHDFRILYGHCVR
jgi:hypothetical protein